MRWLPLIGSSSITAAFYNFVIKEKDTVVIMIMITSTMLGIIIYREIKFWLALDKLKHFVLLQNEMHNSVKQSLKILRHFFGKPSVIARLNNKNE